VAESMEHVAALARALGRSGALLPQPFSIALDTRAVLFPTPLHDFGQRIWWRQPQQPPQPPDRDQDVVIGEFVAPFDGSFENGQPNPALLGNASPAADQRASAWRRRGNLPACLQRSSAISGDSRELLTALAWPVAMMHLRHHGPVCLPRRTGCNFALA